MPFFLQKSRIHSITFSSFKDGDGIETKLQKISKTSFSFLKSSKLATI